MKTSRPLLSRWVMFALVAIIATIACRCTPDIDMHCIMRTDNVEEAVNCVQQFNQMCPETMPLDQLQACHQAFMNGQTPGASALGQNNGTNQIVAPPSQHAAAPEVSCDGFRLTSPLDGMPNGVATFYWDGVPAATAYRVHVTTENGGYTYGNAIGTTSTSIDVSEGAIGAGYTMNVVVEAWLTDEVICTTGATIMRASASNGGGSDHHESNDNNDDEGGSEPEPVDPCVIDPNSCIH